MTVIYPYFQELDNETNKKWVAAWRQRYGAGYPYITDSANTVWNGWHLWAMAANKAGSLEPGKVIAALESGLSFDAPEGKIRLDPQSHHVVHTVHLAKVNDKKGFTIFKSIEKRRTLGHKTCLRPDREARPTHAVHAEVLMTDGGDD